jgi:hypothetical protein
VAAPCAAVANASGGSVDVRVGALIGMNGRLGRSAGGDGDRRPATGAHRPHDRRVVEGIGGT